MTKIDSILYEALVNQGRINKDSLQPLIKEAEDTSQPLASVLVKHNIISEQDILDILAQALKLPFLDLKTISIDKSVIDKVPLKIASYYKFIPLKINNRILTIAVASPLDIKIQDEIRMQLGYDIEMSLCLESDLLEALKKYYGLGADTLEKLIAQAPAEQEVSMERHLETIEDIEKLAEDASVIKLVNQIILEGWRKRATDIHIEPYRGEVTIRYRIDGLLYDANVPPQIKRLLNAIISRIKIMSNLNIVEHRLPQDGRAIVKTQEQALDLRISIIPTPYGESLVIRILPTQMLLSLEKLGFSPKDLELFEKLILRPHGIIFVTGPTGSGKTTTLYTCLSKINTKERKIITIEDPIEYELKGITQIQVMPQIGLDFARGLRSMLRHDPDVMMVGEVRDLETAEIAIRVALTGHLIFSTLHTNDAASSITRLLDIGLEPYLVASSVEAFIAQRLVRVICPHCKEEDRTPLLELRKKIAQELGLESADTIKIFRGSGCQHCNSIGFYGRTAIFEILLVDEVIKDLILKRASAGEIKKVAMLRGMRTLRQDGWQKVIAGITTPEEVIRVALSEEFIPAKEAPFNGRSLAGVEPDLLPDKRVYYRLNSKINIRYKVFKTAEELLKLGYAPEHFSVTRNISAGGLLFMSNESIPISSILELKIELPDGKPAIVCLARLLRIKELQAGKSYDVAACFLDITGAQRARLEEYVETKLEE